MMNPFHGFLTTFEEVAYALSPLFIVFLFFQFLYLKLPRKKVITIMKGFVLTFFGLAFFLQGVNVSFMPVGEMMGRILGDHQHNWILIPIGLVLGFLVTFAEPAVRVHNQEVDKASTGSIPKNVMLITLSTGIAVSVALSMARVLYDFSIWYVIIPGYILAFLLTIFTNRSFTAIAFDSGGVATGPMTVTFILSIVVGVATEIEGRDPLLQGFGMISLVALAPILSVLVLGILYNRKGQRDEKRMESS